MDRLILEAKTKEAKTEVKETSVQTQAEEKQEVKKETTLEEKVISKQEQKEQEITEEEKEEVEDEIYNGYLSNFDNLTLSDVKSQETVDEVAEEVQSEEIEDEQKEQISPPQIKEEKTVKKLIIEKPNYDFIAKSNKKEKKKGKLKTIVLTCALAICSVLCVSGAVMCDQLNDNYLELQDTYDLNLRTYLSNINKLNITNQGLEFLETYPEELNAPSDIGKTSNWFDRLANFIAGLFGG